MVRSHAHLYFTLIAQRSAHVMQPLRISSRVALTTAADSSIAHTHTVEEKVTKLKRRREQEREARHNVSEIQSWRYLV